ncbi:MAG: hypothetical protein U0514_03915 [Candidatus Andersenbacteria bacterium]
MAKIVEKYFDSGDFLERLDGVRDQVVKETGFTIDKEIFRGTIYQKDKLGSVIYSGRTASGQAAVLKLQGLKLEVDEVNNMRKFMAQNQSTRVRVPKIYAAKPWDDQRGYAYIVMESVPNKPIFTMPWPSTQDLSRWFKFYEEYATKCLNKPWVEQETADVLAFTRKRVEHWRAIRASRIGVPDDLQQRYEKYLAIAKVHLPGIAMTFQHGMLTANDVHVVGQGYVLMSNLYWTWRPQLYDAVLVIWRCLTSVGEQNASTEQGKILIEKFYEGYQGLTLFNKKRDLRTVFVVALLERLIGALLVDLVGRERSVTKMHEELFDHYLAQLAKA